MSTVLRIATVIVLTTSIATARLVRDWSYEEMIAASDLVVIADPQSTTPTSDMLETEGRSSKNYQGLDTRFRIAATFKGEHPQKDFTVLHFRYAPLVSEMNGAQFVDFRLHDLSFSGTLKRSDETDKTPGKFVSGSFGLAKPSYMLFLKKRPDGRYEPVAGQYDAEFSCREVTRTLPAMLFLQD